MTISIRAVCIFSFLLKEQDLRTSTPQETVPVQASITLVPPPPLGQWRCCQGGQHRHASREYGLSEPTFYSWKSEFQDMSVSELQRLKHLEDENRCLKQLYAELSLEHQVTKEVLRKK